MGSWMWLGRYVFNLVQSSSKIHNFEVLSFAQESHYFSLMKLKVSMKKWWDAWFYGQSVFCVEGLYTKSGRSMKIFSNCLSFKYSVVFAIETSSSKLLTRPKCRWRIPPWLFRWTTAQCPKMCCYLTISWDDRKS